MQGCSLDKPVPFQPEVEVSSQGCALVWTCLVVEKGSKAKEKKIHFRLSKKLHEDIWESCVEAPLAPLRFLGANGCDIHCKKESTFNLHQTAPAFLFSYCLLPLHQNALSALLRIFSGRGVMCQGGAGYCPPHPGCQQIQHGYI